MPRPKKCRRVCALPREAGFSPLGQGDGGPPVEMAVDEYEAVRLIDLLGCTQEECAAQMGVARTTVQAVYDRARRKLAEALVRGRGLEVRGGEFVLCSRAEGCCGSGCAGGGCARRRCAAAVQEAGPAAGDGGKKQKRGCCHHEDRGHT